LTHTYGGGGKGLVSLIKAASTGGGVFARGPGPRICWSGKSRPYWKKKRTGEKSALGESEPLAAYKGGRVQKAAAPRGSWKSAEERVPGVPWTSRKGKIDMCDYSSCHHGRKEMPKIESNEY